MATFRWGILGTGSVSQAFLLGLQACSTPAAATVVASRTRSNAERFAKDFGVPVVASSYEAAAASSDVDALYIATPPSAHETHALAGIAAGKPVLIEKPIALDAPAAARIIQAARANGVFCVEGMWTRFQPLIRAAHARLVAGEIGEVRAFRGEFCGPSRPDVSLSNFDPARGGGTLMHKGVYAASLARLFLGPVTEVSSMARIGSTGVDEDCALVLRHEDGSISTIRASNRTTGSNDVLIYGTKGLLHLLSPIARPPAARFTYHPENTGAGGNKTMGKLQRRLAAGLGQNLKQRADPVIRALRSASGKAVIGHYRGNGFSHEADALMQGVAAGATESELMPLDQSLEIMAIIDKAKANW
ncbi:MAG: Gfo/Idh/MocA family oxidoreductase [Rhodospirillales bacterium]|nr:Gfo/Idh/MocA family oxidoreductase [Rhodospirillales bacterium]